MTLKQLELTVTNHLIESTGIKERLHQLDKKMTWVLGLISLVFVALLGNALR